MIATIDSEADLVELFPVTHRAAGGRRFATDAEVGIESGMRESGARP